MDRVVEDIIFDHFTQRARIDSASAREPISNGCRDQLHAWAVRQGCSDDHALRWMLAVMESIDMEAPCPT